MSDKKTIDERVAEILQGTTDREILAVLLRNAESDGDYELVRALLFVVRLLDARLREGAKRA